MIHIQTIQNNTMHSFSANTTPTISYDNKLRYSSTPTAISISKLESLGINKESRIDDLLAIQKDESKVYTITNPVKPNRMIAALIIRSNDAITIMIREGNILH
jgi:hypothetical protein